jgi:hypothetical protein
MEHVHARSERMVARRISGELLLVPLAGRGTDVDAIYSLNRVAAFVWELLDGVRSDRQVVEAVVEHFDVSAERGTADFEGLMRDLLQIGAVELRPGP